MEEPEQAYRNVPLVKNGVLLFWFGILLLVCYGPVLRRLVTDWIIDEDMGHGFFVPAISIYIIWQHRHGLDPGKPAWTGMLLVAWGCLQAVVANLGAEFFLGRVAFLITLVGSIAMLWGWGLVRQMTFPLVLLLFMIPLPSILYNQITFPLQLLASSTAEHTLQLVGIPVLREGNILELASQKLSVVEACSGIRSLLSLSFLSLVYAYFFDERPWMRPVLFIVTVPIAILANSARVTFSGVLSEIDPELAKGFYHSVEGWVIFVIALIMLFVAHQVISRVGKVLHA